MFQNKNQALDLTVDDLRPYDVTAAPPEEVLWKSVRTDALPTELVLRWQAQRAGALSALDEDAIDGPARRGRGLPVVNVVSPQDQAAATAERSSSTGVVLCAGVAARCAADRPSRR